MSKRIDATAAKNNFGGLLEDVASLGSVEIIKHGRLVAVVLSPAEFAARRQVPAQSGDEWRKNHVIPAHLARSAHIKHWPLDADDDAV